MSTIKVRIPLPVGLGELASLLTRLSEQYIDGPKSFSMSHRQRVFRVLADEGHLIIREDEEY